MLTADQKAFYEENGYLLLEEVVPSDLVEALRRATDGLVERSRTLSSSDAVFDLEPGHGPDSPRLRRVSSPVVEDQVFWDFASDSVIADIVCDLVGPDVKFHHSKLNFKWARGGTEIEWHQDIQFWPHTNYSPLTIGTYLHDCGPDQGPLTVIPGSHDGPLYDLYGPDGGWTGALSSDDVASLPLDRAVTLPGPAGSVTIHNCRTVHSSARNTSDIGRPLLLNTYSSADAMPYTHNPLATKYYGAVIRGQQPRWARHDPRPCLMPPDWSHGYTSIFALQQGEDAALQR